MAFCRSVLVLGLIYLLQSVSASKVVVPVFVWGDIATASIKSNPLTKISQEEFKGQLKQQLDDDPFLVVFSEETLSVEDLSLRNSDGETAYPYLHSNIGDSLYLPSVESPLLVLKKLADPENIDHIKLTENGLSAEIEPNSGKFLFINLQDAKEGESRADLLRRHNDFMENMFNRLQEHYDKVVAVYTAHYPSWVISETHSRARRQAEGASNTEALDGLLLYVKELVLKDNNRTVTLSGMTSHSSVKNGTEMETTIVYGDSTVTLYFKSSGGYWFFNKVLLTENSQGTSVTEELLPPYGAEEVYSISGWSYRCAGGVTFASVNQSRNFVLTFQDMKIQPFVDGNSTEFGDSLNCVGFFSIPIWSGLFVVFILLAITFYGIMMMLDIRTMDRFDDPKGKTITINTAE